MLKKLREKESLFFIVRVLARIFEKVKSINIMRRLEKVESLNGHLLTCYAKEVEVSRWETKSGDLVLFRKNEYFL